MRSLVLKQLRDVGDYVVGAAHFHAEPRAFSSWAYPLDLEFTLDNEDAFFSPRDDAGIPMRVYRSAGRQYNPTRIATWGLAHFNRYLFEGTEASRENALLAARWFAARPAGIWPYEFDWNDLRRPWISCMSQGQGISLLVRAYDLTRHGDFLEIARAATRPFSLPVERGGVRSLIAPETEFLEEYPSPKPEHVLNGALFALMGLSDLERVDPSVVREAGFDSLLHSLESAVGRWDLGYWSAYDLARGPRGIRNIATPSYHRLHISQLRFLARRHELRRALQAADRWERYSTKPLNRARALVGKIAYRGLVKTQR